MLTSEQKRKLNPEQLKIAESWERAKEERDRLMPLLLKAQEENNHEDFRRIAGQMANTEPDMCAHGRSIYGSCMSCEEIDRLLNPELFCSRCEQRDFNDDLVNGVCVSCLEEE